jgi:hypothetical protein
MYLRHPCLIRLLGILPGLEKSRKPKDECRWTKAKQDNVERPTANFERRRRLLPRAFVFRSNSPTAETVS